MLYESNLIKKYIAIVEEDVVKSSGQLTKLSRIKLALEFAITSFSWRRESEVVRADLEDSLQKLNQWRRLISKHSKKSSSFGLLDDFGQCANILDNEAIKRDVEKGPNPPNPTQFDMVRIVIAIHLLMACAQKNWHLRALQFLNLSV